MNKSYYQIENDNTVIICHQSHKTTDLTIECSKNAKVRLTVSWGDHKTNTPIIGDFSVNDLLKFVQTNHYKK